MVMPKNGGYKICLHCNKEFYLSKCQLEKKNYCNINCFNHHRSESLKGKPKTEEHKRKLSEIRIIMGLAKGEKNPMYGKHMSFEAKTKSRNKQFKGGSINKEGYKIIKIYGKAWKEHIWIYCQTHGLEKLPEGFCVHHIDHNKLNNNPENLILISKSNHARMHNNLKKGNITIGEN